MPRLAEFYETTTRHDLLCKLAVNANVVTNVKNHVYHGFSASAIKSLRFVIELKKPHPATFKFSPFIRLNNIVVSCGFSDAIKNSDNIFKYAVALQLATCHKPFVTMSKKSIAAFQLRDNMAVGAKVTLRNKDLYHFLDKLINQVMSQVAQLPEDYEQQEKLKAQTRRAKNSLYRYIRRKPFEREIKTYFGTVGRHGYAFGLTDLSLFHDVDESGEYPKTSLIGANVHISSNDYSNAQLTMLLLQDLQFPISPVNYFV